MAFMILFHFVLSQASPFVSCQCFTTSAEYNCGPLKSFVCVCARALSLSCEFVHVCEFLEEGVIFHFVFASCIDILIMTILTHFSKGL